MTGDRVGPAARPGLGALALVAVLGLLAAAGATAVPGAAAAPAQSGPPAGAAELRARADAQAAELARLDAERDDTARRLEQLAARLDDDRAAHDDALDAEDRARQQLARYSVSAYVLGGAPEADLARAALTGTAGDLDAEGRRVLAGTAHRALVDGSRRAVADVDRIDADLAATEEEQAAARQHLAELATRRPSLEGELASTRAAAEQARLAEERAAAERARAEAEARVRAAEDQLRANTPRPVSAHTGVVPPRTVPAAALAALGAEIPFTPLDAYWRAAALVAGSQPTCGIDWALVAAIGKVETDHGRFRGSVVAADGSTAPTILGIALDGRAGTARIADTDGGALDGDPVADRAVGPMQFIPGTWRAYAGDGNGDGIADPHNVYDAALAAATYLCRAGGGSLLVLGNQSRAVFAYNRSLAYNVEVLGLADHYRRTLDPSLPPVTAPSTTPPDPGDLPPPASPIERPPPGPVDPVPGPATTTTTVDPVVPGGP